MNTKTMFSPSFYVIFIILFSAALYVFVINATKSTHSDKNNIPLHILHFDVNKTMIAEDLAGGKTITDVVLHALAEEYRYAWNGTDIMSYATYIKNHVLPGEKGDSNLKKLRNQALSQFIEYLEKNQHPLHTVVSTRFQTLHDKLLNNKSVIFPSFYSSIDYMEKHAIPYMIALRTFGEDLDTMIKEIHTHIRPNFFSWQGIFESNGTLKLISLTSDETIFLDTPDAIYQFLKQNHENIAIQDNYTLWNKHGELSEYGKLFPIDIHDKEVVSLFFDDNGDNGIINPRDPVSVHPIAVDDLIENGNILVVDMLKAIEYDNYFINHITSMHP